MTPPRTQTEAQLAYNIRDLRDVIAIWDRPECAGQNPKLPQYLDELHACLDEIARRRAADPVVVVLTAETGEPVRVRVPIGLARQLGLA